MSLSENANKMLLTGTKIVDNIGNIKTRRVMTMIEVTVSLLVDAIKGCQPSYEMMNHPFCMEHGIYRGSYGIWEWCTWKLDATDASLEELIEVYKQLKSK